MPSNKGGLKVSNSQHKKSRNRTCTSLLLPKRFLNLAKQTDKHSDLWINSITVMAVATDFHRDFLIRERNVKRFSTNRYSTKYRDGLCIFWYKYIISCQEWKVKVSDCNSCKFLCFCQQACLLKKGQKRGKLIKK